MDMFDCVQDSGADICSNESVYDRFEYEQSENPPTLRGRMRAHIKFWEDINANSFILDVIRHGYKIPFKETPLASMSPNNKSALEHSEFVESAILDLVKSQAAVEVSYIPHVVSPLSVSVQSSGKKRLILDLRIVNKCIWKEKFKCEDWRTLIPYLAKGGFLFNFDLKSGYHHVEIFPEHLKYLGFSWVFEGVTKYFCFSVLPFGLSSAPYIFTKLLRPLVKYWRFNGVNIVVYLDDGCGSAKSHDTALLHSEFVRNTLRNAGLVVNSTKSIWTPVQSLIWLGICWDLASGVYSITEKRIEKFLAIITDFLNLAPYVTARDCARITGHIMSLSPVIGNLTRFKTRFLYKLVESRASWFSRFNIGLHNDALEEIFFWKNNVVRLNIKHLVVYSVPKLLSFSDASQSGCGAFISGSEDDICYRSWSSSESNNSSTWRELKAIEFALHSFRDKLACKSVKWCSDNQAAVRILQVGSPKRDLHKIAVSVFCFCKEHEICVFPEWIPREFNQYADQISKNIDFDDWRISREFFCFVDQIWGPHSVDRFASSENAHLSRFNSKFFTPNSENVDAFSISWKGDNNWLVPPINSVSKTIQHLLSCNAFGTLVVPFWPSSPFWPFLFVNAHAFHPYVKAHLFFPSSIGIITQGNCKDTILGRTDCAVLVVRIAF